MFGISETGYVALSYYSSSGEVGNKSAQGIKYEAPTVLIINGHANLEYSHHASAFNNLKIWDRVLNRTEMLG